ncbi:MAG: YtxH domain-containing protein, partial [Candidatus Gracilibacteria bacterium]
MSKKGGKIALALGLITGALTGILFAPEKGKELRGKIMNEKREGGSGAKAVGDNLKKMGSEIYDLMKEIAETEEVKGAVGKAKGAVAEMANVKKEKLDELLEKAHKKAKDMKKLVSEYVK